MFCSSGLRNGPCACSASGSPSTQPVARPSQNVPPCHVPPSASKWRIGPNAYAALGGLRFPKRPGTAPSYTPPPALMAESGPVNPTSGAWHAAHAWPGGSERLVSKNNRFPSSAIGLSANVCVATAGAWSTLHAKSNGARKSDGPASNLCNVMGGLLVQLTPAAKRPVRAHVESPSKACARDGPGEGYRVQSVRAAATLRRRVRAALLRGASAGH